MLKYTISYDSHCQSHKLTVLLVLFLGFCEVEGNNFLRPTRNNSPISACTPQFSMYYIFLYIMMIEHLTIFHELPHSKLKLFVSEKSSGTWA